MERNASDSMNTGGTGTGGMGAGGTGGFGQDQGGSTGGSLGGGMGGSLGGATGTGGTSAGEMASNVASEASNRFQQGKEAMTDKLGQLKGKAGDLKSTLADRLEAGANSLRERGQSGQLAGATGAAGVGVSDDQMQKLSGTAANALQSTATFLREGDLQASIEEQVRTNPGRTLLIALGVGYMLGKALRR
jgi:hypothetical protein